jgi:hypothetical protein
VVEKEGEELADGLAGEGGVFGTDVAEGGFGNRGGDLFHGGRERIDVAIVFPGDEDEEIEGADAMKLRGGFKFGEEELPFIAEAGGEFFAETFAGRRDVDRATHAKGLVFHATGLLPDAEATSPGFGDVGGEVVLYFHGGEES